MKKISALALLVTLGLAAPALAQTPADVRNHRQQVVRDAVKAVAITKSNGTAVEATEAKGKKAKKHAKKKYKKAKKHVEEKKEEIVKDAKK